MLGCIYLTLWNSVDCSPPGYSALLIFPRQEYWSGLPFPSPWESQEDPRHSGWSCVSCVSCTGSRFFTTEPPGKPNYRYSLTYAIKWEKKIYLLNGNVILSLRDLCFSSEHKSNLEVITSSNILTSDIGCGKLHQLSDSYKR